MQMAALVGFVAIKPAAADPCAVSGKLAFLNAVNSNLAVICWEIKSHTHSQNGEFVSRKLQHHDRAKWQSGWSFPSSGTECRQRCRACVAVCCRSTERRFENDPAEFSALGLVIDCPVERNLRRQPKDFSVLQRLQNEFGRT